jgi:hypothetical protein
MIDFVGVASGLGGEDPVVDYSVSMNASMTEAQTVKHPRFLGEVESQSQINAIVALVNGTGVRSGWASETSIEVKGAGISTSETIGTIDTENALYWHDLIVTKGQTTYDAPTIEWTITGTTRGGISTEDMSNFSYINTPPNTEFMRPPTFTGRNWRFVGASQNRARGAENTAKTWSKTWILSPPGETWNVKLYTPYP